ncbi:unnamed protein product [Kuraishia capsulata CBS 1993]|uniref:CCAAT-binding factor domain-containing protein n=1 Tax=Kuraishia capsulata CBS 1993 TaxID=1382522 RepID=W6MLJ7_9ASCO|nr:uncharacterized protein KUCA_T00001672001 [Kuraishia capsulata CBS 1993]CDK25702.1 unnamed protein product [Kuraishia capsulata CBS 1993]
MAIGTKTKVNGKTNGSKSSKKELKNPTLFSIEQCAEYRQELLQSTKNINLISELLQNFKLSEPLILRSKVSDNDLQKISALSVTLAQVFLDFIKTGRLKVSKSAGDKQAMVAKWLKSKYSEMKTFMIHILSLPEALDLNEDVKSFKIGVLEILMKLLKAESDNMGSGEEPYFSTKTYGEIIYGVLLSGDISQILSDGTIDNYLLLEFMDSYFNRYWDLKYYFMSELKKQLEADIMQLDNDSKKVVFSSFATLVKMKNVINDFEKTVKKTYTKNPPKVISQQTVFKQNFEKNWITLLNFPLELSQYKLVLLMADKRMIPFFNNPTKLMDFLTNSYDTGFSSSDITISILALNGLFGLMRRFNLEYPDFFKKLYAILTPELLHLTVKSRFFRLLDVFMGSTHLSSSIVASFIKRLARIALTAPPSGVVIVIPFIYNLLKRHPTCMLLLHNTTEFESFEDPFDEEEEDPSNTNALKSSIWELQTMMNHYHPNVASLAKILQQHFNKYSYNMEDFLDWNYNKFITTEFEKKAKGEVAVDYEKWDTVLGFESSYLPGFEF